MLFDSAKQWASVVRHAANNSHKTDLKKTPAFQKCISYFYHYIAITFSFGKSYGMHSIDLHLSSEKKKFFYLSVCISTLNGPISQILAFKIDTIAGTKATKITSANGQRSWKWPISLTDHSPVIGDDSRFNIIQKAANVSGIALIVWQFTLALPQPQSSTFNSPYSPDKTSHNTKSCWEAEKQVGRRPVMNLKQHFECTAQMTCPWLELVCGTMCWQQLISARSLGQAESSPTVTGCNELLCQSLHTPSSSVLAARRKQSRDCLLQDCGWFEDQDGGHTDVWVPEGFV